MKMIEEVKTFVERKLLDAKNSNDLEYIRTLFFSAFGAVSFVVEFENSDNLAIWWDEEMREKFIELMN